jgi:hypothetical protein
MHATDTQNGRVILERADRHDKLKNIVSLVLTVVGLWRWFVWDTWF